MRTLKKFLACFFFILGVTPISLAKIAIISTEKVDYEGFEIAQDAIDKGAKILLFPEWGFYADEPLMSKAQIEAWQNFSDTESVYIALNVRYQNRNTLLFFSPNQALQSVFRRDGANSEIPENLEPLVADTEHGRIGFLICDESRNRKFLDELRNMEPKVDFILSPNTSGDFSSLEAVKQRAIDLDYWVNVYSSDKIGAFTFNGGNRAYAFIAETKSIEIKRYEDPFDFASWENLETSSVGNRYFISLHQIPKTI